MKRFYCSLILIFTLSLLVGCSTNNASQLRVSNDTNSEITGQDTRFAPLRIDINELKKTQVFDSDGHPVNLVKLASEGKPILVEAYWCPHCQRTLVLLHANATDLRQLPIILSTGFPPKTSLQDAIKVTHNEFSLLGLSGYTVYYSVSPVNLKIVPVFPTLIFGGKTKTVELYGEHSLNVWKKALN